MRESVEITRQAPVAGHYQVVVCGGGPAGLTAAISAARAGRRTALIERLGFLGGSATAGLVVPMSGFFFQGQRVVGGIAWELASRLIAQGAAQVEMPKGHISFHPEYYKLTAQEMVEESGVDVYAHALLSGCLVRDGRLSHVVMESKNGTEALSGQCFIDATGEADLCRMAAAPMEKGHENLQPMSLCFLLEGVDLSTELMRDCVHHAGKDGKPSCNQTIRDYLSGCVERGQLEQFGGPWFNTLVRGGTVAVNVTRRPGNACCRASLQAAEEKLRRDMFTIVELLRRRYPEFRRCEIVASGVSVGVREAVRIQGITTVTGADLLAERSYPCPVARCAHPMDLHHSHSAAQDLIPLTGPAYIPHTALLPHGMANLIAAGRCISCDAQAYASLRVQATMMATGESAGVMAALYCRHGGSLADLDPELIHRNLLQRGVLLPAYPQTAG